MAAVLSTQEAVERLARKVTVGVNAAVGAIKARALVKINRSQDIRRTKSGRTVGLDPSHEGEPPKRLTGALIASVSRGGGVERKGNTIIGFVSAGTKYARRLELGFVGTDSRGRRVSQGPRPYLRPSLREVAPNLANIIINAAKKA